MGWTIAECVLKTIFGIIYAVLLLIALLIAGGKTLFDGLVDGYWHKEHWKYNLPDLLRQIWDWFKEPIFD